MLQINYWSSIYQDEKMYIYIYVYGVCSGTVGWGTALQAGKMQVRFPVVSLELFIDNFWPHHRPGVDSAFNRIEYQEYLLGEG